jgi:pimeloyl-ACP methyl ester carboxylesterase
MLVHYMQMAEAIHRFVKLFGEEKYFRDHKFIGIGHSMGTIGLILSTTLLPPLRFEQLVVVETNMAPPEPEYVTFLILQERTYVTEFPARLNGENVFGRQQQIDRIHGDPGWLHSRRSKQIRRSEAGMIESSISIWYAIHLQSPTLCEEYSISHQTHGLKVVASPSNQKYSSDMAQSPVTLTTPKEFEAVSYNFIIDSTADLISASWQGKLSRCDCAVPRLVLLP